MRRVGVGLVAAVAAGIGLAGAADAAGSEPATTVWRNPKNSVHVRLQPCGNTVCGFVIWANARAQEKARRAGTPNLVGTQLFREFRQIGPGKWSGKVFVPDLGRTFSGTLTRKDQNSIVGRGCLIGGFFCKSQTWKRIG